MQDLTKLSILIALITTMQAAPVLSKVATAKSTQLTLGTTCKSNHKQGKASHSDNITARKNAIKNWSAVVVGSLGVNWASWKYAKAKALPCQFSNITKKWNCRAIARPCHYLVLKKRMN